MRRDCTLQQSMYVSTWLSAFAGMKLGGTAEVYYTLVLSADDRMGVFLYPYQGSATGDIITPLFINLLKHIKKARHYYEKNNPLQNLS